MTKNRLPVVVGLMVVLAAAAAAAAGARHAGFGPEGAPGPKGAFIQDLSDEQRTAIREITLKHRKEMIPLRAEMETRNLELEELVRAGAGEAAIFAKLDEIGALRTEMTKKRMAMQLEIRAQLTDEQKEMFDRKHMMMGHMGAGGGYGLGGGPGGGRFK
ncbi:MAG TPA: Spy/CpxP family protein refolding chaperone [bacterium]|nr:Spy/CpxP family protein refolding chaperone [bacterium]